MEQIYFDEIHRRKLDGKNVFLKTLIILGCIPLCVLVFLLGGPLGVALAAGVIYGAYFLFLRLSPEYEYIYTGGEVDIDVIYGKSSRRRLITIKPRQVEFMGKTDRYFAEYKKRKDIQKILDFSDGNKTTGYVVIVNSNHIKKLVLFSPSDRLVEQLKPYLRDNFTE